MNQVAKIGITGTKGKTTVANVVASVLQRLEHDVLRVDTTGHYVNGEQRSTLDDSRTIWNLVPSVCPGRYLWEFKTDPILSASEHGVAVLECALGCSGGAGLGYRQHEVGVFLNVMEDHLGSSERLKTQADIARAKQFIFTRVKQDGYAVFNADDQLVVDSLAVIPAERNATLIACGAEFAQFDTKKHIADGGVVITREDNNVICKTSEGTKILFDLTALPWAFNGAFTPSVYNLLHVAGALYGHYRGVLPDGFRATVEVTRLDPYGGRLTLLKAENGAIILADYAHEKVSLAKVGELARTLTKDGGKVIGVTRLAYDRSPELIKDTGEAIANSFDQHVIYDKVDGYWVKSQNLPGRRFQKTEGYVSQQLADAITPLNPRVERIVREDEAIARAAELAGPNDAVVVIVNDNIRRSIGFIKESFTADFI